jgi:transposase
MNSITYVGLDVHVAVAKGQRGDEVLHVGVFPNRPDHIAKLVERLGRNGSQLSFCYEAGPCGYGLQRQLTELGHDSLDSEHESRLLKKPVAAEL